MPIKPQNRARYPKDWPAISRAARERAGWKCQHAGCAARQYAAGEWRQEPGGFTFVELVAPQKTWSEARQAAAEFFYDRGDINAPPIVIVLTVAHLNHQPEDCRPENLAAMCQRHHLAYDHDHHQANAQATRRSRLAVGDLFDGVPA